MNFNEMRNKLICFLFILASLFAQEAKVDLNSASLDELKTLPISEKQAKAIYQHRIKYGRFPNIYALLKVDGIEIDDYKKLKEELRIEVYEASDFRIEKIENMYYQLSQFASEGTNDNESDNYIDLALNPNNINRMSYQELLNLPNVSPIDAQRVKWHTEKVGKLKNQRDLRLVDRLDYYGYRNMRNFISYKDGIGFDNKLHGFYTYRSYDTDFIGEEGDVFSSVGYLPIQKERSFNVFHKARFTYNNIRSGVSYSRHLGEENHNDYKYYASITNIELTPEISLNKVILGNYNVTFGHGVVMENTDFFSPRKDGFGFKKRYQGIIGDVSRSRNHNLFGLAANLSILDKIELTAFLSNSKRDAILNEDGSVNSFITLKQRYKGDYLYHSVFGTQNGDDPSKWDLALDSVPNMAKTVEERTFGGELKFNFSPGTFLGFTYYESWYDRLLRPNLRSLFIDTQLDNFDGRFRNNELVEGVYGGRSTDFEAGDEFKSFRRVYGFHGQFVLNDWAFSGEYGILDTDVNRTQKLANVDSLLVTKDTYTPTALVLSSYFQKANFNLLLMYRDYDLAYDNPYQHSNSNYQRFKGTMIDDDFRLKSPYYTQLYFNADQPQAERGFHLRARYRMSRTLTFITEDDLWERVSDGTEQYRFVVRGQYSPVFPIRLEVRQKWQARDEDNQTSIDYFFNNETRIDLRINLSGFDRLRLSLGRSYTRFSPRPNLTFNPSTSGDPYDNIRSAIQSSGNVIGLYYLHNFNTRFSFKGQFLAYKGFYWNFEDTQFTVLNSLNGSYRYWLAAVARLSNNLSCRIKYTHDEKQNDSHRFIRSTSSFGTFTPTFYQNVEENGSKNNLYFELVMSF